MVGWWSNRDRSLLVCSIGLVKNERLECFASILKITYPKSHLKRLCCVQATWGEFVPDGVKLILSARHTEREPHANKQRPRGWSQRVTCDWSSTHNWSSSALENFLKNAEFHVCLGGPWCAISERRLPSENKTFKPAITPTRFPPRAPGDFFLKHYPNAPRHIKYEYVWIDRSGRAIRALQSLA